MIGSMGVGYLANYISPRTALMGIYLLRAILMIIFVFIPISITTVIVFSCLFGVSKILKVLI
jgi:predicted MFS family arabinose efflux permease